MPQENEQALSRRVLLKSKPFRWFLLLLIGFLAGFLWQYIRAQKLESELEQLRQSVDASQREVLLSGLRDQISLTYFEATRKNYGLAGEHSTRYFDALRATPSANVTPELKQEIENLISFRDRITAGLASADPAVIEPLQQLLLKTFQITSPPGAPAAK